jgi:tetratricopeptide (TPR) repeat protein
VETTVPGKSKPLRMAVRVLHLLTGALLSCAASAQDDAELSRLIFEVAPLPADTAAPAPTTDAPGNAGPQTPAAETLPSRAADISAYRARINDLQVNENPYSAILREQYDALGTLLQETGDHEAAITAFESAMHIDRVNEGLYTLKQIPLVEKIIASHETLGNSSEVNDFHAYLFYLQQKTYAEDDPRLLAAKEDWADWNVASYLKEGANYAASPSFNSGVSLSTAREEYIAVQRRDGSFAYVPRSQMLGAMGPMGSSLLDPTFLSTYGVDAERIVDERLRTARDYYEEIIKTKSAATEDDASATTNEAYRVEHKLANVAYAVKAQLDDVEMVADPGSLYFNRVAQPRTTPLIVTRGYTNNRDALEAIAEELENNPAATVVEKAQAWIHLGDWHVGFDHAARSDEVYGKAWNLLNAAGFDAAAIAAVFMPAPLVPVPAFVTHPYSRTLYGIGPDAPLEYQGHMDMTLDVSRYGDVSGMRIDTVYPETTSQTLRSELLDYLRRQKMRPAVVDGKTVKREDVRVRYYYSY